PFGHWALAVSGSYRGRSRRVRPPRYGEAVGKVKQLFACSDCGRQSAQWSGKCPWCGSWGTVSEQAAAGLQFARTGNRTAPAVSSLAPEPEERRIRTGLPGVDRVLGGGLVPGSVV